MAKDITIKAEVANATEEMNMKMFLKRLAALPADDRERIGKLASNPKALKGLKEHWATLQSMF